MRLKQLIELMKFLSNKRKKFQLVIEYDGSDFHWHFPKAEFLYNPTVDMVSAVIGVQNGKG